MDYQAIDAVVNIWTPQALSHRPDWTDEFFIGKVKGQHTSAGISLETMLDEMDRAGIGHAFLVAAKAGRPGLPGCYHMPPDVVADAEDSALIAFESFGLVGDPPPVPIQPGQLRVAPGKSRHIEGRFLKKRRAPPLCYL